MSFFKRLKEKVSAQTEAITGKFKAGLSKTRGAFAKIEELVLRSKKIDEEFFEELEEILIGADVGVNTVIQLVDELRDETRKRKLENSAELQPILSEKLVNLLH
ncbi:MAG TPA: signal recognition particle-docking protein FtsY, partial [Paenibacillaceae bacterium]|nr:signal recognition particle-docking protein FtsY [Paenibacillaceae bacterium]